MPAKTLKIGQPNVIRIYNPKTGTYYLVRRRHDSEEKKSIQGKYIHKKENKHDATTVD